MTKKQQGFTLIELVAVIVILGALAVVALPRFVDLQGEAEQASADGVAGGISSAFAVNYAASLASDDSSDYFELNSGNSIDIGTTGDFDINDIMQTNLTGYSISGNCDVDGGDGPGDTTT
ncbi:MAG: type II secretion system protein, partial [Halofilum sp. (in: g-proteobacteria)]